ncbi:MAG: 5-dehydro-4-deoxyglucarate dehydratase [Leucobacter sp.]
MTTSFGDGVLFFPVTPFTQSNTVDTELLKEHVSSRLEFSPGGVFPACGTGEIHALSAEEIGVIVRATREVVTDVPVFGGTGGPLGHAIESARIARDAGADGLLVLPPYLVNAPADGLVRYVEEITAAAEIPVILYHRANARYTPDVLTKLLENPLVTGFKDGIGDVALTQEIVLTARELRGENFEFFNGLLTAELSQRAYKGLGVPRYSSAAFAMIPEVATAFYNAYRADDDVLTTALLDGFYRPLIALRDTVPGYGVSLVKAGVRLSGLPVGPVRAPLLDPSEEHLAQLTEILEAGRNIIEVHGQAA